MNIANKLTLLRIFLVPIYIACYYLPIAWNMWLGAGVFILAAVTDVIDGNIARKYNLCTDFGRFMDPMADKLLTCSAFIMLTAFGLLHPVLTILFVAREFIISGFRLIAVGRGTVIAAGAWGKLKTVLQCIAVPALMLWQPLYGWIGWPYQIFAWAVTGLALAASLWSCGLYLWKNRKMVSLK
ncbi:MAG: CDP-diacylglycerol--glycerol-3-phosphate 3-phosphatidyltransferase [Clostridiales bacterium]|nr:CDP-diacylglycerol--glycerol-3-phosphate 3-phosphatidyltransferase [Clostridiales bacterium]